ncbi:GAF domain-containing protein [Aquabacterium sp.]|uniref:GAF domain-containing protein n=1 Tax=Aquabacterium sp. TaxID=1872578 RepID=UPI00378518BB
MADRSSSGAAHSPPFGEADLTNCERELIHLAGSIQPHGLLLVLDPASLTIQQLSANAGTWIGLPQDSLHGRALADCGGNAAERVRQLMREHDLAEPVPLRCTLGPLPAPRTFEGSAHRSGQGSLIVELEPVGSPRETGLPTAEIEQSILLRHVGEAVQRFSAAASLSTLADAVAQCLHDLTGYDRVMVYKFDPDGHGKIIAEARDPRLASLLGHHYPASDIPQRARELYLRNRVRVLVDVHYEPVPLQPRLVPASGQELDMSLCQLRSMSPLHLQYLKNMGVTATLVVSLVREGRLWGLIAAHHYSPRHLRLAVRAACDLLAEVIATRISAIENYAHAQVAILVRRLEQRLVEATSIEGDWRLALFRNPRTLLQPLEATGAALFHDGEVLTAGEVPSTPELRALMQWIDAQPFDPPFACSSVGQANPALESLTPTASGVLAVKLSTSRPDYLMWFRKEQLLTVTWAGDPHKPTLGDNPLELSPRRSFAAWSEIVRGTALPWSGSELALGRAIGAALVDIIVQVHAVRLLVAEHQLVQIRATVQNSREPVAIADAQGSMLFSNQAFVALASPQAPVPRTLDALCERFAPPASLADGLRSLRHTRQPWRGELALLRPEGEPVPVALRAEIVPGRDGTLLGFIVTLTDLSESRRAAAARRQLEESLQPAARDADEVVRAIVTNASLAAMDIADGSVGPSVAPLLNEVELSTQRAAALYARIRGFGEG